MTTTSASAGTERKEEATRWGRREAGRGEKGRGVGACIGEQ
jgi:hypothetical protein